MKYISDQFLDFERALPALRRGILDLVYRQGHSREICAYRLGLSWMQFEFEHRAVLRSLRAGHAGV